MTCFSLLDCRAWQMIILTPAHVDTRNMFWSIEELFSDVTHLLAVCMLYLVRKRVRMMMYDVILVRHVLMYNHT